MMKLRDLDDRLTDLVLKAKDQVQNPFTTNLAGDRRLSLVFGGVGACTRPDVLWWGMEF